MISYKHILIATDLSAYTDKITDQVMTLAQHGQASISLVHVVEHTPIVYGGGEFSIPLDINLEEALIKQAEQALTALAQQLKISASNCYVLTGSIKQEVVKLAEKLNADLIVVGTH